MSLGASSNMRTCPPGLDLTRWQGKTFWFMRSALIIPILALAGCATPSDRIADALVAYGLAPSQAQCIGQRLEDRLSVGQLRELASYARAYGDNDRDPGAVGISDLIRVAAQVHDPRVPVEVGKAAAHCGLLPTTAAGFLQVLAGV